MSVLSDGPPSFSGSTPKLWGDGTQNVLKFYSSFTLFVLTQHYSPNTDCACTSSSPNYFYSKETNQAKTKRRKAQAQSVLQTRSHSRLKVEPVAWLVWVHCHIYFPICSSKPWLCPFSVLKNLSSSGFYTSFIIIKMWWAMETAAFIVVSYLFHFAEWQRKHCLIYIWCHSICP